MMPSLEHLSLEWPLRQPLIAELKSIVSLDVRLDENCIILRDLPVLRKLVLRKLYSLLFSKTYLFWNCSSSNAGKSSPAVRIYNQSSLFKISNMEGIDYVLRYDLDNIASFNQRLQFIKGLNKVAESQEQLTQSLKNTQH